MTFTDTEEMLKSLRALGARVARHRHRIKNINEDFACINSALGGDGTPHAPSYSGNPKMENLINKLHKEEQEHLKALDELFAMEDKLSQAINTLSPEEQDVIIGMYMDRFSVNKLVRTLYMGQKTIYRRRNSAIKKISEKLTEEQEK